MFFFGLGAIWMEGINIASQANPRARKTTHTLQQTKQEELKPDRMNRPEMHVSKKEERATEFVSFSSQKIQHRIVRVAFSNNLVSAVSIYVPTVKTMIHECMNCYFSIVIVGLSYKICTMPISVS